MLAKTMMLDS